MRLTVPRHDANADRSVWVEIPVQAEDALDGKMTLVCESLSGPNLMIDRVVFTDANAPCGAVNP